MKKAVPPKRDHKGKGTPVCVKASIIPVGLRTGTEMQLFLGLDEKILGHNLYGQSRVSREYESMEVLEIRDRIDRDMAELIARAYPNATEEWGKKFAPAWWQECGVPHDKRSQCIGEKRANHLREGLWERLNSQDATTAKAASAELTQLLTQQREVEPKQAAQELVRWREKPLLCLRTFP